MEVVESGICSASLVLRAPLKSRTSSKSSPCGVNSKSLATLTLIPMVWRALFGCLEGAPLTDYREFEAANFTAVLAWRDFYVSNYAFIFGRNPKEASLLGKGKEKKEEEMEMFGAEGQPPLFNPTAEFFSRLLQDYQG